MAAAVDLVDTEGVGTGRAVPDAQTAIPCLLRIGPALAFVAPLAGRMEARARLREQSRVSLKALAALQTTRQQIGQWNDRKRAFLDQRGTVILSLLPRRICVKGLCAGGGLPSHRR